LEERRQTGRRGKERYGVSYSKTCSNNIVYKEIYHYICNYAFISSLSIVTEIYIIIYVIMLALLLDTKYFTFLITYYWGGKRKGAVRPLDQPLTK